MTTLNLARNLADAVLADCRVIVTPGWIARFCAQCAENPNTHDRCDRVPPRDLVAAAEGKCETCGGDGQTDDVTHDSFPRCPTCLGSGRPRVALVVDCERCGGWGYSTAFGQGKVDCQCCTNGKRTVGTVTITAVVPIIRQDNDRATDRAVTTRHGKVLFDVNWATGEVFDYGRWLSVLAPDGPESLVGMFAVLVDDVRPS